MPNQHKKQHKKIKKKILTQENMPIFKRLLHGYVKPYTKYLIVAFILMVLVALSTACLAKGMQYILDEIFEQKNAAALPIIASVVFIVFFIKGTSTYGQTVVMNYVGQRIISDFQRQMFNRLVHSDLTFFHNNATGSLISRFTNDVTLLRAAVSTAITGAGRDFLSVIFLVGVMFHEDWLLASISFFVFPVAILPVARFGKKLRKVSTGSQEITGKLATLLTQVFQGIRHVKAYSMEDYEQKRADGIITELYKLNHKVIRARAAAHPIMECLGGLAIVVVILYGGYEIIEGTRTTGSFFAFVTALLLAYEPMKKLASLNSDLQEGIAAAQRVFSVLDRKSDIIDMSNAQKLTITKGSIDFNNVTFAYNTQKKALDNLSINLKGGKMTALVGPSGGGKSTILNLIPRFYDIQEGAISIDGQCIKDMTLQSLRENIALVSQEISLFDDTIRANIAYGRLSASEEDIIHAAKEAAAHEFIIKLPHGYDTIIGEHGVKLSGGQRQRISIARAMLKNAPILLLDEATSALDTESERKVQEALNKLMGGRTTLVIAHRLSTIVQADHIYVIDQGQVLEQGDHTSLIAQNGLYARLSNLQSTEDEQRQLVA